MYVSPLRTPVNECRKVTKRTDSDSDEDVVDGLVRGRLGQRVEEVGKVLHLNCGIFKWVCDLRLQGFNSAAIRNVVKIIFVLEKFLIEKVSEG